MDSRSLGLLTLREEGRDALLVTGGGAAVLGCTTGGGGLNTFCISKLGRVSLLGTKMSLLSLIFTPLVSSSIC